MPIGNAMDVDLDVDADVPGVVKERAVAVGCAGVAAAEFVMTALLEVVMAKLKPLTGTPNMVAADDSTVVVEAVPVVHDTVWPEMSLDVHWDGKYPPVAG